MFEHFQIRICLCLRFSVYIVMTIGKKCKRIQYRCRLLYNVIKIIIYLKNTQVMSTQGSPSLVHRYPVSLRRVGSRPNFHFGDT
ncbi:unnamed protein product [Acanthoscelides obtectus]|uniref:Uncharacterized protein n=1 Tax=Acanthoscelides obtectus TaxID=200917 RepID=A0A9P0JXV0_ACAOB|nr:unnamed protein product [Acanthoscelides obtectus]CAK1646986.1 hypothetical protein AOBTE_LOCUS14988 [Acanthoscelides obtectus]